MDWYYVDDGQSNGPHRTEDMKSLILVDRIDPTTLVWREGLENWHSIRDVPELAAFLFSSPPPIQAPSTSKGSKRSPEPSSRELPRGGAKPIQPWSIRARPEENRWLYGLHTWAGMWVFGAAKPLIGGGALPLLLCLAAGIAISRFVVGRVYRFPISRNFRVGLLLSLLLAYPVLFVALLMLVATATGFIVR